MNMNLTELIFVLDRSGSMGGLESDTIGGFNSMLAKQQEQGSECRLTTILFDNEYEILHDRIDIKAVSPITEKEYYVRGSTALLDAIGRTINKIGNAQKHTAEEYRAGKVLVVITTDGMENASREYTYRKVKSHIERQKSKYDWEFIFLGANIDAVATAGRMGITMNRAKKFRNDREGIELNYKLLNEAAMSFRQGNPIAEDWGAEIEEDYKQRGENP